MSQTEMAHLCAQLVSEAMGRLSSPRSSVEFVGIPYAHELLDDLSGHSHAFVIACIMDRQMNAEKAWSIPYELQQRIRSFEFAHLARLSLLDLTEAMAQPQSLHRFPNVMSQNLYAALHHVEEHYHSNAAEIWAGRPSSATIVRRFLEFDGVGQKIATIAANMLVRDFRVPVSDHYSIDISVDVQVRRVFARMGFAPQDASADYIIYRARELHPEYPGIFDLVLWEVGRTVCRNTPQCDQCRWSTPCAHARQSGAP